MKKTLLTLTILAGVFASHAYASDADIQATMLKLGYQKNQIKINKSPVTTMKTVTTDDAIFYVTTDGKFLTQGPIYNMQGKQAENIADEINLKLIKSIENNAIVYKAKDPKYDIYVFTDYTCGYCKKLHEEIDSYLKLGISVHYFAFPRKGLESDVAKDMQSIWSAKDRKAAFDNAYKGGKISPATSMVPFVKSQFQVGLKIGLTGTPAIVLPNGQLHSGYVPAEELLEILKSQSQ